MASPYPAYIAVLAAEIKSLTAERDAAISRANTVEATTRELCKLLHPEFREMGCWCPYLREVENLGHTDGCVLARALMHITRGSAGAGGAL